MSHNKFLSGLFQSILGNAIGSRINKSFRKADNHFQQTINQTLASKGEVSSKKYAESLLENIESMSEQNLKALFDHIADNMEIDSSALSKTAADFSENGTPENLTKVRLATDSMRLELFRRLGSANQGIIKLVQLREQLLRLIKQTPKYKKIDVDLCYLFREWFNKGFLVLQPVNWSTAANILEKIIQYEAVHEIKSWRELRERLDPADRRCFAFFHPVMEDEPLIFVEVALTKGIPSKIDDVLGIDREAINPNMCDSAVFYSISNCQRGLLGISFGNFLIKSVVQNLQTEFKNIQNFVTLSPLPDFRKWAKSKQENSSVIERVTDAPSSSVLKSMLRNYFLKSERKDKKPNDPVARFHLGNGASLHQINVNADTSNKGTTESFGLMVNYKYSLSDVEHNHESYQNENKVIMSRGVRRWLGG